MKQIFYGLIISLSLCSSIFGMSNDMHKLMLTNQIKKMIDNDRGEELRLWLDQANKVQAINIATSNWLDYAINYNRINSTIALLRHVYKSHI